MVNRVPIECYEQFGTDLDGCSTQQNEGCGRCHLVKTCDNCLNYKDSRSPEEFPCDNCEWNINNCCNYPQTDIDCCVLGSKQIKKITDY